MLADAGSRDDELVAQRDGGGVAVLWIGLAADSSLFMVHPKLMILHAIYE